MAEKPRKERIFRTAGALEEVAGWELDDNTIRQLCHATAAATCHAPLPPPPTSYLSDLTDEEWQRVAPIIPAPGKGGRPRTLDMRQLVNALLYLAATRCKWRELPAHFPKRGSVRTYHDRWKQDGTWEKLCEMIKARASDGGQPLMREIRPADLSTRIAGPIQTTGPLQQATGE